MVWLKDWPYIYIKTCSVLLTPVEEMASKKSE